MQDDIFAKIAAELPAELTTALRSGAFTKVASQVMGTDASQEHNVYARLGTSLFVRLKEASLIRRGLESLASVRGEK